MSRRVAIVITCLAGLTGFTEAASPGAASAQAAPIVIKEGKLDLIKLLVAKLPAGADAPVLIRRFATEATDFGTGKAAGKEQDVTDAARIQADGPALLAGEFVIRLKKLGLFATVATLDPTASVPSNAIVIEGRFLTLDPGDTRKRKLVGMGSGKTTVRIEGVVKDGAGATLAEFMQERFGASSRGSALDLLISDSKSIGQDVANFLDAWGRGKNLK